MKIAAVDDTLQNAVALQAALRTAGFEVPVALAHRDVLKSKADNQHADRIADVEVIVLHVKKTDHSLLDALARFSLEHQAAVAVFTEDHDPAKIRYAMQIGVGAYVIDGFDPKRLGAVIDVARARFDELCALYKKIEKVEAALLERKIVERAKGLVMKRRSCDEQTAYRAIQKAAMDRNLKMVDVARQVLNVSDLMQT